MTTKLPLNSHPGFRFEKTGINSRVFTPKVIFSYLKKIKNREQKTPLTNPFSDSNFPLISKC